MDCAGRAVEAGVAEREDPPVSGDHPVAPAIRGGGHAHDWLVQVDCAGRAVKAGVAEGEDPPVSGDHPVAPAIGGGGHAHDWLVQVDCAGRAVKARIAEGEDAAVGGDEPVPVGIGGGGHAYDRLVEPEVAGRSEERCVAIREDAAVAGHEPVATVVTGRSHTHDRLGEVQAPRTAEVGRIARRGYVASGVDLVVADRPCARESDCRRGAVRCCDGHGGGARSERTRKETDVQVATELRDEDDGTDTVPVALARRGDQVVVSAGAREGHISGEVDGHGRGAPVVNVQGLGIGVGAEGGRAEAEGGRPRLDRRLD